MEDFQGNMLRPNDGVSIIYSENGSAQVSIPRRVNPNPAGYLQEQNATEFQQESFPIVSGHQIEGGAGTHFKDSTVKASRKNHVPLRFRIYGKLHEIEKADVMEKREYYIQRRREIKEEINKLLSGTHPVFQEMVVKIEQERDVFLSQAKEAHQSKMDLYDKELESLEMQASIDFENEKKQLVSKLISNVEEKRRKIKEERESLDITSDHLLDSTRGPGKRNLRNRGLDTVLNSSNKANVRRKQTQNQGITNLTEEEIIADLTEIRKFTGVTGPLSLPNGTKKGTKSGRR